MTNVLVKKFAFGSFQVLFTSGDSTLYTVGLNSYGQLGDGTTTDRLTPVSLSFSGDITHVAAGNAFSVVVVENRDVWTFGENSQGQSGRGTIGGSNLVPVLISETWNNSLIHDLGVYIAYNHKRGKNGQSQLGDGTATNRESPVIVRHDWDGKPDAVACTYHTSFLLTIRVWYIVGGITVVVL